MVNTLFERDKKLSSTAQDLNNEMKYVKRTLILNCYPKWTIQHKKKKPHNEFFEFISKVILPYTTDLGESLNRFLEKHRNPNIKHNPIFKKEVLLASKCRSVVCEIPCGGYEDKWIGQKNRRLSTRLKECHRDTLPYDILKNPEKTALTKHAA